MNNLLYFVPMIAQALQHHDVNAALRKTFRQIRELGSQSAYAQGYQQFLRLMEEARLRGEASDPIDCAQILESIMSLFLERAVLLLLQDPKARRPSTELSQSPRCEEYEKLLWGVLEAMKRSNASEVTIRRDEVTVGTIALNAQIGSQSVEDIVPGDYLLVLDTGRIVWKRTLSEREVFWRLAYPDRPLDLAADTGESRLLPTVEDAVLLGELILRVFPGLETGRLEVEVR